ncbi:MAG: hypothetical protein MI921_18325, partial [Cytophagales bacterium]|nr:hypothetical protein [Cytophagales bacterium]
HGHAALLSRYHRVVANSGVRPITAAVAAVLHFRPRDTLVVGAETPDQVRDIAAAFSEAQTIAPTTVQSLVAAGADASADLIDPRTWL